MSEDAASLKRSKADARARCDYHSQDAVDDEGTFRMKHWPGSNNVSLISLQSVVAAQYFSERYIQIGSAEPAGPSEVVGLVPVDDA